MERNYYQMRLRGKDDYPSYKNKIRKFSNKYSNERKYDSYKSLNDQPYSYKRSDRDSYDHEDYYVY